MLVRRFVARLLNNVERGEATAADERNARLHKNGFGAISDATKHFDVCAGPGVFDFS